MKNSAGHAIEDLHHLIVVRSSREAFMEKAIFAGLLRALTTGVAAAQTFPFNEAGVTNGHWHLNSNDVSAN
jgi:hypothetical protein